MNAVESRHRALCALPARAGVGLKPQHYEEVLECSPRIGFFEVHAENYMGSGGAPLRYLERIRSRYPLSLHGVGLSIGGDQPLDRAHLRRVRRLVERYAPDAFSEHLAWSSHDGIFLNDLLPICYDRPALSRVSDHVNLIQDVLGIRMLLENPSTYVTYEREEISETEFLGEVARRTGCGLLLDINNVFVSATNHAYDPLAYFDAFPAADVAEIHLAGFSEEIDVNGTILTDAHACPVAAIVWRLFAHALRRTGPVPTLIEWDKDVPSLATLLGEARKADRALAEEAVRRRLVVEAV
jgi:uncharacterized protein (UPF0276 family)